MSYQKPSEICTSERNLTINQYNQKIIQFASSVLEKFNLRLRKATLCDIENIDKLAYSRYPESIVKETSHFTTYRFVKYGNVFIIENDNGTIIACIYEQQLREKISFATRLIVDSSYEGIGLPKILTEQTYLSAINEGSIVRNGIIAYDNIASHIIHLNKLGWSYTGLVQDNLEGVKDHFEAEIGLTPDFLLKNTIDEGKLSALIGNGIPSEYAILNTQNLEGLQNFFKDNEMGRIVALIRSGLINNSGDTFFLGKKCIK